MKCEQQTDDVIKRCKLTDTILWWDDHKNPVPNNRCPKMDEEEFRRRLTEA